MRLWSGIFLGLVSLPKAEELPEAIRWGRVVFYRGSSENTPLVLETEAGLVLVNLTAFYRYWNYHLNANQRIGLLIEVTDLKVTLTWETSQLFEYNWKRKTFYSKLAGVPIKGSFEPEKIRFPIHDTSKELVIPANLQTPCDIKRLPQEVRSIALQMFFHAQRGTNSSLIGDAISTGLLPLIKGDLLCNSLKRVDKNWRSELVKRLQTFSDCLPGCLLTYFI